VSEQLIHSSEGMLELPAIGDIAKHYGMNAAAFAYTFRSVAMPHPHTEPEFVSCILVAREHGLNPLTREIYFMRTKNGTIQAIISVDGWVKKCNEHPKFDGMEFHDDHDDNGALIATTCTIYRGDRKHPIATTEYLDECARNGGPVWRSAPRRMLRHRALTQAARYAFGFAGLMDRDEFDQWQAMKDVTPRPTRGERISAVLEPPNPDDEELIPPTDAVPVVDAATPDDAPLAPDQEAMALESLAAALAAAPVEERAEVAEGYASVLDRMSDAGRRAAEKLIDRAASAAAAK